MAEEQPSQEKTEEPTPQRLNKAKEEGQFARSRELASMALVVGGTCSLMFIAPSSGNRLMTLFRSTIELASQPDENLTMLLRHAVVEGLLAVLPFVIALFVVGIVATAVPGGATFSAKALAFKGNRISPISGFKRIFSIKAVMELGKSIGKFILIAGMAIVALTAFMDEVLALGALPPRSAVAHSLQFVALAVLMIGAGLILVAAVDVPFQMAQHKKQLRMTKQEVKDELKESEGRPEVKSRVRQLQQEISKRQMLAAVPDADVIITNPEHYSVALKYDAEDMGAPIVVAKGGDHLALKIREIGSAHDIPQIRVPPLTRALYFATEVGEHVPGPLYVAVAQVLAYVYQLERYRRGQVGVAPVLGAVEIPEEFVVE